MPQSRLNNPSSTARRLLATVGAVPVAAILFAALLVFNLGQMLSVVLIPFSRRAFRAVNRFAANTWWGWCVLAAERLMGVREVVTGDPIPMRENAIVLCNHQDMPDITFLMAFARTKGRLGDLKFFVKEPIKYVPGVGWGMVFLDCLFVKRNWTADRDSVERTFARLNNDEVPVWLVSFVEGTRIKPLKLAASREYARSSGLTPPEHVLVPRTKGFAASVEGLRGNLDAVYDVTIGYPEGVPDLWQYARGFARVAHLHVRRYAIEDLPEAPQELATWLHDRFREKDALLDGFYGSGAFPALARIPTGAVRVTQYLSSADLDPELAPVAD